MIALPSDIARANGEVRTSYQKLLEAMSGLLQKSLELNGTGSRKEALALTAQCIGGMVIARSLPNDALASEVRSAALEAGIAAIEFKPK